MAKPSSNNDFNWRNYRWLTALIGLGLLILGQFLIARESLPKNSPTKIGEWLNGEIHLAIPSIDNVLTGLPLLLVGILLFFLSVRGLSIIPREVALNQDTLLNFKGFRATGIWFAIGSVIFILLLWQLNVLEYHWIMVTQWLFLILLFSSIAVRWDQQRDVNLAPALGRVDLIWMVGLFSLGLVVGTYRLQGLPDMLIGDEGAFFTTARDIALGKNKPSIFASGVYTFPVMSSMGQALAMRIFGINLWGWRFSSVLAGLLSVFPMYLLGREAFNRRIAIISCLALIFSPYFLAFSRLGYNNIQALFITTLSLYWLYIGIRRSSHFYNLLAGLAAGLGFYTYFAARMTLVISLVYVVLLVLTRKIKPRQTLPVLMAFFLGALIVIGPYITYGLNHDAEGMSYKVFESVFFNTFNGRLFYSDQELTSVLPFFEIGGNELFYQPRIFLVLLTRGLIRTLLIFQKPWLISEHFIASPLTGTIGVIFYLIGFVVMIKHIRESRHLLLFAWFIVTILGLSVLNTVPPRHTHMVSIIPAICLLTGLGIYWLMGVVASLRLSFYRQKDTILALFTAAIALGGIHDYFIQMPEKYKPNPDQIISWAGLYATDESLIYIYSSPEEADLVHPYLISEFFHHLDYKSISLDVIKQNTQSYVTSADTIFFYLPVNATKIEPILIKQWGKNVILRDFYSPDGMPVLSAGMNMPFIFERDRSILAVLAESYGRVSLITLFCIVFLLNGLIALFPQKWLNRLPRWLQKFTSWLDAPVQSSSSEEFVFPEVFLIESRQASKEAPPEPPAWARDKFPSTGAGRAGKLKLQTRTVRSKQGRDFYLHLHFPTIYLPWNRLPASLRVSMPAWKVPMPAVLTGAIFFAITAQIFVSQQLFLLGVILYLLCIAGMIYWSCRNRAWVPAIIRQVQIPPRTEIIIGLITLAVVIFTRFYDLGYRVYGLEADETKWTVQSWLSTILRVDLGEFSTMHYQYLPVDFWVRSIFLRLFGLNFISARIESAVFSTLAAIALYWIVRRLTSSPAAALLASSLYSFSYLELNASHQALHNTTLEPWMMVGLLLTVMALQEKRLWLFQGAGIVLALGMLTYETFFPTVAIVVIYVLATAIIQLFRRKDNLRHWLPRIFLLIWPVTLTFFLFTQKYLEARHGYHFGWLEVYTKEGTDLAGIGIFVVNNIVNLLKTCFLGVVYEDSLLRYPGSLVNQWLLPFIILGLAYNLGNLRKSLLALIPLWYIANVAFAPLLLGSVWPRVLYTTLAPLVIWGALGLFAFLTALRVWIDRKPFKYSIPVFLALLIAIFVNDYQTFTTRIADPLDRVKRRELAEMTAVSAQATSLIVYPYMPAQNDPVQLETHVLLFSVAGSRGLGLDAKDYFYQLPYDQLMTFLWENRNRSSLEIIYDKSLFSLSAERARYLEIVQTCYPGMEMSASGVYFDVYRLQDATLLQSLCYQASPPLPVSPLEGTVISASEPIRFSWDPKEIETSGFLLTLEQKEISSYYFEAEDIFQSNGWYAASEFVTGFSGSGFLLDNWQSGEALYSLKIDKEGDYRIWVRSYKREYNDQQNFMTVDGQQFNFSGDDAPLDQWVWESLGTLYLPAGDVTLGMGRDYGLDDIFSVFIDSILISADLHSAPDNIHVWQPIQIISEPDSQSSEYILAEGLPPGYYRWSVRVFDGKRLVDSFGNVGIDLPFITFSVVP